MKNNATPLAILSWLFGLIVVAIGIVNTFWGNDREFGIFILILSFAFFLPLRSMLKGKLSPKVVTGGKIILGIFIFWVALGVGELFDKIEIMQQSFAS